MLTGSSDMSPLCKDQWRIQGMEWVDRKCLMGINVGLCPWHDAAALIMPVPECTFTVIYTMFYYSIYYQYCIVGSGDIHIAPRKMDPMPAADASVSGIHAFHMCEWSNP